MQIIIIMVTRAIFSHIQRKEVWKYANSYNVSLKKNPFISHLSVRVATD